MVEEVEGLTRDSVPDGEAEEVAEEAEVIFRHTHNNVIDMVMCTTTTTKTTPHHHPCVVIAIPCQHSNAIHITSCTLMYYPTMPAYYVPACHIQVT